MINTFSISGFRQLSDFQLENVGDVNLFLGNNNAGKSSILEGIFALICGENLVPMFENSILRRSSIQGRYDFAEKILGAFNNSFGKDLKFSFEASVKNGGNFKIEHELKPSNIFSDIIPNNEFGLMDENFSSQSIGRPTEDVNMFSLGREGFQQNNDFIGNWRVTLDGKIKKESRISLSVLDSSMMGEPIFSGRFVDILSHRNQADNTRMYSHLKRKNMIDEFIKEISETFEEVKGIDNIPYPDGSAAPVSIRLKNGKMLPLYNFGDGFQRWFNILAGMIHQKNSIHCIEEIDVTFHTSAQEQLSKNIMHYSRKFNNQVFMTLHSIEFVDIFLKSIDESSLDRVRVITLRKDKDTSEIKKRVLTGMEALKSREHYSMELR